jgi:hypothetical protein
MHETLSSYINGFGIIGCMASSMKIGLGFQVGKDETQNLSFTTLLVTCARNTNLINNNTIFSIIFPKMKGK